MNNLSDTASNVNVVNDLSDWSCDPDCLIGFPCGHCQRRHRVARLLAQRDLERRPCTLDCTSARPCERCTEVNEYLAWLYMQRDQVAVLLRALRQLDRVFPQELRELLAPIVASLVCDFDGPDIARINVGEWVRRGCPEGGDA